MKQHEMIKQMSDRDLKKSLFLSQFIMFILAIFLSFIFFADFSEWLHLFDWDLKKIVIFGVFPGLFIVFVDVLLMLFLPERHYDDGGINKRVFESLSYMEIFSFTLFVAIAEEMLFRGVIQTTFGYIMASILFALVHFRYLKKPVLLVSVFFISFFIGYIFLLTENLIITITAHFTVDVILGVYIRYRRGANDYES